MSSDNNIRRRASALCVHDEKLLCIQYRDPTNLKYFWGVPGGKIEEGECPEVTAARELLEETGYRAQVDPAPLATTRYSFAWDGKARHCETTWYLAVPEETDRPPATVQDADYIVGRSWIALPELKVFLAQHPVVAETVTMLLNR